MDERRKQGEWIERRVPISWLIGFIAVGVAQAIGIYLANERRADRLIMELQQLQDWRQDLKTQLGIVVTDVGHYNVVKAELAQRISNNEARIKRVEDLVDARRWQTKPER